MRSLLESHSRCANDADTGKLGIDIEVKTNIILNSRDKKQSKGNEVAKRFREFNSGALPPAHHHSHWSLPRTAKMIGSSQDCAPQTVAGRNR